MMKQFLRVKQIADQKFQRGEKGSVLSSDQLSAERRVDLIRESCSATGKKLAACAHTDPQDKRNAKKIPEAALAHCMEEWGLSLGENSILGMTLVDFARIQEALAEDLLNYKLQVEENVVEPLQNILNVDVNKITKYRKQLSKLTTEMESARTRFQNAHRNSQQSSGSAAAAAKAQLLKEEAEDAVGKVEQCRDSLTGEMFHLISREPEMSRLFVRLCQLQMEHHRRALHMLEAVHPELEAQIGGCPYQPVFGVHLSEHLRVSRREIAIVIESCICWLLESAIEEEGLFRIGGSMIKIKKMKSAFDAGFHHLLEEERDPHNVAGILKLYLRSLPEPLLTYHLYDKWMEAAIEPDHDTRLQCLWSVVNALPEAHFKNLRYLIKFLSRLCQNSEVNKMSIQNVAIVIGPNLLWPPVEECALGMNMTATNLHSSIVDTLITYCDWFFSGECEFYVSTPTSPRHLESAVYSSQLSLSTARLSNGGDSALESMSSSPTNSSPKSPSPRVPLHPRKKAAAPRAPQGDDPRSPITRSVSCNAFQAGLLARQHAASLSVSHENLLSMPACEENETPQDPPVIERRPKPPRGLPPSTSRRSTVGRPSVPPPDRPQQKPPVEPPVVDPEDISLSFDSESSSQESFNECRMSFEESDNDELLDEKSSDYATSNDEKIRNYTSHEKLELELTNATDSEKVSSYFEVKTEDVTPTKRKSCLATSTRYEASHEDTSDNKRNCRIVETPEPIEEAPGHTERKKPLRTHISWEKDPAEENIEEEAVNTCHFTGGTPTWFDHYGLDDSPYSDTVWFRSDDHDDSQGPARRDLQTDNVFPEDPHDNATQEDGQTTFVRFSNGKENPHTASDSTIQPWTRNGHHCPGKAGEESSRLSRIEESGGDFCTVIDVGGNGGTAYRATVSGTAIKLRVNSETQDTRL